MTDLQCPFRVERACYEGFHRRCNLPQIPGEQSITTAANTLYGSPETLTQ
jgi:hypothetical protein